MHKRYDETGTFYGCFGLGNLSHIHLSFNNNIEHEICDGNSSKLSMLPCFSHLKACTRWRWKKFYSKLFHSPDSVAVFTSSILLHISSSLDFSCHQMNAGVFCKQNNNATRKLIKLCTWKFAVLQTSNRSSWFTVHFISPALLFCRHLITPTRLGEVVVQTQTVCIKEFIKHN